MTNKKLLQMALELLEAVPIEYDYHGNPIDCGFSTQLDCVVIEIRKALEERQHE